jgi:hypothetical protein
MKIICTPLPAQPEELTGGRPTILMALDALVNDKRMVVGLTVGSVEGPNLTDVRVSPPSQLVINRCSAVMDLNYPQGVVIVAGVAQVAGAKQRVRDVLSKAPDQAFVLLVCANDKAYSAAHQVLNVNLQAANMRPQ